MAVIVLIPAMAAAVWLFTHYADAPDWPDPSEEARLESQRLVEAEAGLPSRGRWNERRARRDAREIARARVTPVPESWRGPGHAHPVVSLTTVPLTLAELGTAITGLAKQTALLVVVPTLARRQSDHRLGQATETFEASNAILQTTVTALRDATKPFHLAERFERAHFRDVDPPPVRPRPRPRRPPVQAIQRLTPEEIEYGRRQQPPPSDRYQ